MRRKPQKTILAFAVVFLLAALAAFAGNYFYNIALNPRIDKSDVFGAGHNRLDFGPDFHEKWRNDQAWLQSVRLESWGIPSFDGLALHAEAIPNRNLSAKWVVICHGYYGYGRQMAASAREFHRRGFNVLLPDARGCGKSGGAYFGMGWHDRLDVVKWVEEINRRHAPANICLYGVSMGGATVMMASGETLPENVRAIVEDCGYASVNDEFAYQMRNMFGLPAFPFLDIASVVTRIRAGYWLGDADAVKQVRKSTTPILFIHGGEDTFVPISMMHQLFDAAACPKEKLVFEKTGHAASSFDAPERYWRGIDAFLAKHFVE